MTAAFFVARRRLGATLNESVQAVAVLLAVAFAILTLTGVWFRGEGMALALRRRRRTVGGLRGGVVMRRLCEAPGVDPSLDS